MKTKKCKLVNTYRIIKAFSSLIKVLIDEKVIKGRNWHTVECYARKVDKKKGWYIDEIKVSNIKRDLKGFSSNIDFGKMPKLILKP